MIRNDSELPREWKLVARLGGQIMWLTFGLFHLFAAVVVLFLLWWYEIPPEKLAKLLASVPQSLTVQWLALLGLTGVGILALYVRIWKKCFSKLSMPYLFRE